MKKPTLLSCVALALWSLCAPAQPTSPVAREQAPSPEPQARIARVENGLSTPVVVAGSSKRTMALRERMAFYQVPAVSIAVIDRGRVEWTRAYGMADVARGRPATTQTLFQAASISKTLAALGALRLVEQGKLSLDGDANRQLSAWKIPQNDLTRKTPVSLRMLLNHSAGTTVSGFGGYEAGQPVPTLLQVLDGAAPANSAPVRVDLAPATAWRYSGGGYSIVQLMMTEASGRPFDRYMQDAVLGPLGMVHSTFAEPLPKARTPLAATAYDSDGKALAGLTHRYPESAAAGLWTTPGDLARMVLAVQQAEAGTPDSLVSRDTAATMLKRGQGEYGLGFFVEDLGDRTSFSHSGGNAGFRSRFYGYTRSGHGVVVMTNGDNGGELIEEILRSVAAEYGWPEFKAVEKAAIAGDADANGKIAGDYRLLDKPVRIVAEGERLYFQCELFGAKRMELFPQSPMVFFPTAQNMSIRFERGSDGAISGFGLERGGRTYPGTRIR